MQTLIEVGNRKKRASIWASDQRTRRAELAAREQLALFRNRVCLS